MCITNVFIFAHAIWVQNIHLYYTCIFSHVIHVQAIHLYYTCIFVHVIQVQAIHLYYTGIYEICVLQVFTHELQVYDLHVVIHLHTTNILHCITHVIVNTYTVRSYRVAIIVTSILTKRTIETQRVQSCTKIQKEKHITKQGMKMLLASDVNVFYWGWV